MFAVYLTNSPFGEKVKINEHNLTSIGIFLSDFAEIGDFFQKCEKFPPWAKILTPSLIILMFCLFVFTFVIWGG